MDNLFLNQSLRLEEILTLIEELVKNYKITSKQ